MFEHKTEQQAREEILNIVKEYCETYHNQKKAFKEGDRISYASRVYDSAEMVNLIDSSLEFWLTSGRYTAEFEKKIGRISWSALLLPCKFGIFCKFKCIYGFDFSAFGRPTDQTWR